MGSFQLFDGGFQAFRPQFEHFNFGLKALDIILQFGHVSRGRRLLRGNFRKRDNGNTRCGT
jgi:hypothetical protein